MVQMNNTLERLRDDVQNQESRLKSVLTENESLLLEESVDYQLKGDKILVTVHAVPKELASGESLFAVIAAG